MSLKELTRKSIEAALAEADKLGPTTFRKRYGFGKARDFFIEWNGASYDSKAIAGAAHGYLPGKSPLTPSDFSGGEKTVAHCLRELGFDVPEKGQRNANWTRDELILALDLYVRFDGNPPGKGSPEIRELSAIINQLWGSKTNSRSDFRNQNGVYMKCMNFRRWDPVYKAQGKTGLLRGNKLEGDVWKDFASDPKRLGRTVEAIRANLEFPPPEGDQFNDDEEAEEGRILTRAHQVRERKRSLVIKKKASSLKKFGELRCEACEFEFGSKYGERGIGIIDVHHAVPVEQLRPGAKTKLSELHLLCANCHRTVHAKRPWLTLDQLKECISNTRVSA